MDKELYKIREVIRIRDLLAEAAYSVQAGHLSKRQARECLAYAIKNGCSFNFSRRVLGFVLLDQPPYSIEKIVSELIMDKSPSDIDKLFSDDNTVINDFIQQAYTKVASYNCKPNPQLFNQNICKILMC